MRSLFVADLNYFVPESRADRFSIAVASPNKLFLSYCSHLENSFSHAPRRIPFGLSGNGSSKFPLPPRRRRILTARATALSLVVCRVDGCSSPEQRRQ